MFTLISVWRMNRSHRIINEEEHSNTRLFPLKGKKCEKPQPYLPNKKIQYSKQKPFNAHLESTHL